MKSPGLLLAAAAAALFSYATASDADKGRSAEAILRELAADYRSDPTALDLTIGFDVDDEQWLLKVDANDPGKLHDVELTKGFPDYPVAYWVLSRETLQRIDAGMTGETATQRARADDPRLMVMDTTGDFPKFLFSGDFWTQIMEFKVHFFAKGIPEIVSWGIEHTVDSHGARIAGIHYAPKLSVFSVHIPPNSTVNEEEDLDTNPFETVWIATSGKCDALVGGNRAVFEAGNAMFIPKGVAHVFANPYDEPFASVMILFGDGLNE